MAFKEPGNIEVYINTFLGYSIGSSFYKNYVESFNLTGSERVLDYGSGSGALSKHIAPKLLKNGGHLTCVDISNKWMDQIQKKMRKYPNVDFKQGNINDLMLEDNSYDIVVIHYMLHDIEPSLREQRLRVLVDKLKYGGRLYIREPLAENHGIKTSEIRNLMSSLGLKEISLKLTSMLLLGKMTEAIYKK